MRIIYKIKFKIPKKRNLKKKLTHNEAVQIINNSEQLLGNLQEQFKLHIFPFINTEIINENNNEIIRIINNPDKTINDLITQALYLENKIEYAKKYITEPVKTLMSYILTYKEPSEQYQKFLDKILNKNRLAYLPIEIENIK